MDDRLPQPIDIQTAKLLAGPLAQLGLGRPPGDFFEQAEINFGTATVKAHRESTIALPAFALTKHNIGWILWLRGIETWGQGANILTQVNAAADNDAGFRYAIAARQLLESAGWQEGDGLYISGHSYGGMTTEILTGNERFHVRDSIIQQHTFGAPRPAPPFVLAGPTGPRCFRWCVTGDIIPHVPPTIWEMTLACSAIGATIALRWQLQNQPRAGLFIDDQGHIDLWDRDTPLPFQEVISIIPALLGGASLLGSRHRIETYLEALTAADQLIEPPSLMRVTESPPEPPIPLNTIEFFADVKKVQSVQTAHSDGGPRLIVTIPKGFIPEVKRVGVEYAVVWQGQTIALFAKKSQARILARDIKTVIRRGQYAEILYIDAYLQAMNLYLTAATDPTGGFNPVPSPA